MPFKIYFPGKISALDSAVVKHKYWLADMQAWQC